MPVIAYKERPILFSAPMVRAILSGTKTQTRRVVRDFSDVNLGIEQNIRTGEWVAMWDAPTNYDGEVQMNDESAVIRCPYGQPGDRLYVRETWCVGARWDDSKPSNIPPNSCTVLYRAGGFTTNGDDGKRIHVGECSNPEWSGKTRTAIHMPRWASRIDLEVTGVRVERLNDISEADAVAEGIQQCEGGAMDYLANDYAQGYRPASSFRSLWQSINGADSWAANPFVWVVEFKRIKP